MGQDERRVEFFRVDELLVVLWLELLRREDQLVIAQILVLKGLPLFEFLKLCVQVTILDILLFIDDKRIYFFLPLTTLQN